MFRIFFYLQLLKLKTYKIDLSNINLFALLVVTIASLGLGALWYGPVLIQEHGQQNIDWLDGLLHGLFVGLLFCGNINGNQLFVSKKVNQAVVN